MNRRRPGRTRMVLTTLALGATLLTVFAGPASAHGPQAAHRGDRLDFWDPPATMAAWTPFYLSNGYCTDLKSEVKDLLNPTTRVDYTLDGRPLATRVHLKFDPTGQIDGICIALKHLQHDFRFGLPRGTHTIEGCWYWLGELDLCKSAVITFQ